MVQKLNYLSKRIFVFVGCALLIPGAASARAISAKKVKDFLEREKPCFIAFGSIHPIFPGTDAEPNIDSTINCISDVTKGQGVNKIEACAFIRYDTETEKYISLDPLQKRSSLAENKACDWETSQSLLEMESFYPHAGAGKTPGDFLFYGSKPNQMPILLFSGAPQARDWLAKQISQKSESLKKVASNPSPTNVAAKIEDHKIKRKPAAAKPESSEPRLSKELSRGALLSAFAKGGLGNKSGMKIVTGGKEESFSGPIDREAIRRVIQAKLKVVRDCYQKSLKRKPDLFGKMVLKWEILEGGTVGSTDIASNDLEDRSVAECVLARLWTWRFPEPASASNVTVTYPFSLSN